MLIHWLVEGDPEENLTRLWADIVRLYGELKTENKYWIIRMSMFTTGSQPKMKGKAAEVNEQSQYVYVMCVSVRSLKKSFFFIFRCLKYWLSFRFLKHRL